MTDSMPPEARSKAITYWDKMGRLNLLTGLIGLSNHQKMTIENQKNQQAESAYVRRTVWGETEENMPESDDMATQTILGDVTNPTPIVVAGSADSTLKTVAVLGMAGVMGLGGAGAGAAAMYWLSKQQPQAAPTTPIEQNDFSVGLGKIEDYLQP